MRDPMTPPRPADICGTRLASKHCSRCPAVTRMTERCLKVPSSSSPFPPHDRPDRAADSFSSARGSESENAPPLHHSISPRVTTKRAVLFLPSGVEVEKQKRSGRSCATRRMHHIWVKELEPPLPLPPPLERSRPDTLMQVLCAVISSWQKLDERKRFKRSGSSSCHSRGGGGGTPGGVPGSLR